MVDPEDLERRIAETEAALAQIQHTVATLIVWMSASANSPIRRDEAERLLQLLEMHLKVKA